MSRRVLLVDGDIIAYRSSATAEKPTNWGGGLWTLHAEEDEALSVFERYHEDLMEKLEADHAIYCLTDSETNFRKHILPTYKSHRKDTRKPMLLPFMREYLMVNYDTFLRPRLEGDDVMGILATHAHLIEADEKIIVSLDKDMKTVPGWVYNDAKDEEPQWVTQEEADYWHLYQTLTGDQADGYTGCPGVGPAAAEKILANPQRLVPQEKTITRGKNKGEVRVEWVEDGPCTPWEAVVCHYHKAGLDETQALTQARVARILRASDYDFKNKEPILWTPRALTLR